MPTASPVDVHDAIATRGYRLVENAFPEHELARYRSLLDRACGDDGCGGHFGRVFHPALALLPDLAPFYANELVVDAVRAALGDEPRLAHSGALVGDATRAFTPWHYHRSDALDPAVWDPWRRERPTRVTRVLANCYLDGCDDDLGPLLLLPRRCDDPLAPPSREATSDWSGAIALQLAPGTVVVFDQSVWHAARPARVERRRRLLGGHYQGWSDPTPHREDNRSLTPALSAWLERLPMLRRLLISGARDAARPA
jgi:hypothetical protein